jgi:agmatinase
MNFLDLPEELLSLDRCRASVFPIAYDETTSWKGGTSAGPKAILEASHHIEFFDEELKTDVAAAIGGIHTFPELVPPRDPEDAKESIIQHCSGFLDAGRMMVSLGGEHSITYPLVAAHKSIWSDISVLQIDAHADLREEYNGSRYNHACPMKRLLDEGVHVTAVGIRSVDESEAPLLDGRLRKTFLDCDCHGRYLDKIDQIIESLPTSSVYVSIDLDGLNPAEMPAVGTPIPGGLSWHELLAILLALAKTKRVVGADVVELMPVQGLHASDSLAARLVYKMFAYNLIPDNRRA